MCVLFLFCCLSFLFCVCVCCDRYMVTPMYGIYVSMIGKSVFIDILILLFLNYFVRVLSTLILYLFWRNNTMFETCIVNNDTQILYFIVCIGLWMVTPIILYLCGVFIFKKKIYCTWFAYCWHTYILVFQLKKKTKKQTNKPNNNIF